MSQPSKTKSDKPEFLQTKGSPKFSLNTDDFQKIVKGATIAFVGAALMQLSIFVSSQVPFDWKIWLTAILSVGVNATWKFLSNTQQ
jgi:hypothetical protein